MRNSRNRSGPGSTTWDGVLLAIALLLSGGLAAVAVLDRACNSVDDWSPGLCRARLSMVRDALVVRFQERGEFPAANGLVAALTETRESNGSPYLDSGFFEDGELRDPWGRPLLYQPDPPGRFRLGSLGMDGRPGGDGRDRDQWMDWPR